MASYIAGMTDYIPQIERFKPDLNLYSTVLQASQSKYDAAKKQLGSLYGSLLYAPMTRDDNIKKRDDYFKMIEQDIKKISGMDLSLPQNVDAAADIFKPIIEDQQISFDMVYTKGANNAREKGNSYKGCVDPDKCGGAFWEPGMTEIDERQNEFKNASPEDAMKMGIPEYTPFINVTDKALKYAKELGMNVTNVSGDGKYLYTITNGRQLMVPLQQIYSAVFGKDPAVQKMYNTTSYLSRKNYVRQHATEYGGDESKAEDAYFNAVLDSTGKELKKEIRDVKQLADYVATEKRAVGNQINREGANDALLDLYLSTIPDDIAAKQASSYYDDVENNMNLMANNSKDRVILRNQIDYMVGQGLLHNELGTAAQLYSQINSQVSRTVDPYAEATFKADLEIRNAWTKAGIDLTKELVKKGMEDNSTMFGLMGTPGQQEGEVLPPGPGNATGPGTVDLEQEATGLIRRHGEQSSVSKFNLQQQYVDSIISNVEDIQNNARLSPDEKIAAKNALTQIFGDRYDANSNTFKRADGSATPSWKEAFGVTSDPSSYKAASEVYRKANAVMPTIKSMVNLNDTILEGIDGEISQIDQLHSSIANVWLGNNKKIKESASLFKGTIIDEKDMPFFDMLFKPIGGGDRQNILNRSEYIDKLVSDPRAWTKPITMDKAREVAGKKFDKMLQAYRNIYNDPKMGGKGGLNYQPLGGLNVTHGDEGLASNRIRKVVDQTTPGLNRELTSFYNNAQGGAARGYMQGSGHIPEQNEMAKDPAAEQFVSAFVGDIQHGIYDTGSLKSQRPFGTVEYANIAYTDPNTSALTIKDVNTKWLESYAIGKKGEETLFGIPLKEKPISQWQKEGVTVYMDKNASQDLFKQRYQAKPSDALLASGKPVTISQKHAGSISIQQDLNNQGITIKGDIYGRVYNPDTKKYTKTKNYIERTVGPNVSGSMLYDEFKVALSNINVSNMQIDQTGTTDIQGRSIEQIMADLGKDPGPHADMMQQIQMIQQMFTPR